MKRILTIFILATLFACSQSKDEKAAPAASAGFSDKIEQAEQLVSENQFQSALAVITQAGQIEGRDNEKVNGAFKNVIAKIKSSDVGTSNVLAEAHLAYAIWMEYYGIDMANPASMKQMMTGALANYRRVLELDPDNDKAIAEIEQIEGIYKQMGREIPAGVAE